MALLFLRDHDIGELLARGRYFPGERARTRRGANSACHSNAAMLFVRTTREIRIATVYVLSSDGLLNFPFPSRTPLQGVRPISNSIHPGAGSPRDYSLGLPQIRTCTFKRIRFRHVVESLSLPRLGRFAVTRW